MWGGSLLPPRLSRQPSPRRATCNHPGPHNNRVVLERKAYPGMNDDDATVRLAMWSGPRNISTAMMRAWDNRGDAFVTDEPLYAHYLDSTGREHPGRSETLAAGETDAAKVIAWLTGPVPGGKRVWYQKHMTQHLLPHLDRGWMRGLTNCFLIRDPREMLTSFVKHVPDMTLADTGYAQQVEIFDLVRRWTGK